MRASKWSCPFLGVAAEECHHETGRGPGDDYLDPRLMVPLARCQHALEHQGWARTPEPISDGGILDPDTLRLYRSGHLHIRLGQHNQGGVVVFPAETVLHRGLMLVKVADRLLGARG
jgi:hypothetical protein